MSLISNSKKKYNSKFLLYCKYYNKSPEEITEIDRKRWDGHYSMGFTTWWHHIVLQWMEYKRYKGAITTVQEPLIEKWIEDKINRAIKKRNKALKNENKSHRW